ncbi:MAG: SDR family NAD(P)-dependent oxidoreductase [Myxococcota bacterium]
MESIRGRRALITGASRGIGRAIAESLAAEGVDVALLARTEAASAETRSACKKHKVKSIALGADVTDSASLEQAIARGANELGGLDLVITAAGVAWAGAVHRATTENWRGMLDVNLLGTMETARLSLPYLRGSSSPTFIFIGSVSSRFTYAGGAGYCASKHGLLGFAGALYEELRLQRIKVCTVCPGTVDTDMTRGVGLNFDRKALLTAEDVAEAVLYVAHSSPRACPSEILLRCHHPQYT